MGPDRLEASNPLFGGLVEPRGLTRGSTAGQDCLAELLKGCDFYAKCSGSRPLTEASHPSDESSFRRVRDGSLTRLQNIRILPSIRPAS